MTNKPGLQSVIAFFAICAFFILFIFFVNTRKNERTVCERLLDQREQMVLAPNTNNKTVALTDSLIKCYCDTVKK